MPPPGRSLTVRPARVRAAHGISNPALDGTGRIVTIEFLSPTAQLTGIPSIAYPFIIIILGASGSAVRDFMIDLNDRGRFDRHRPGRG
jgi:hypothetical protein